jgi:hypothetical protein
VGKPRIVGRRRVRAEVAPWFVAWVSLFALWLLYVDVLEAEELVAGAAAAATGATAFEVVRRQRTVRFRAAWRWLLPAARLPVRAGTDFAFVMAVLWRRVARRTHVRGSFIRIPVETGGSGARAVARRTLLIAAGSFAPNAYVVELREGGSAALVHRLVGRRGSDQLVPRG